MLVQQGGEGYHPRQWSHDERALRKVVHRGRAPPHLFEVIVFRLYPPYQRIQVQNRPSKTGALPKGGVRNGNVLGFVGELKKYERIGEDAEGDVATLGE